MTPRPGAWRTWAGSPGATNGWGATGSWPTSGRGWPRSSRPPRPDLGRRPVEPGRPARFDLACEAGPSAWTLTFEAARPEGRPLLTVLWNGRVVREAYAEGGRLAFTAKAVSGANALVVESVGGPVTLLALERAAAPPAQGGGLTRPPEHD